MPLCMNPPRNEARDSAAVRARRGNVCPLWSKSPPIRDPQGTFLTQAVLSTNLNMDPCQILRWFVSRWLVEVTFHEVRTHLGVETQRQWSDAAIARTTPTLLGLFSLVTLLAHQSAQRKN